MRAQLWYIQAEILRAETSWYEEVSNPGGIQGHYTQIVWADTGELGCGFTHYKVTLDLDMEPAGDTEITRSSAFIYANLTAFSGDA